MPVLFFVRTSVCRVALRGEGPSQSDDDGTSDAKIQRFRGGGDERGRVQDLPSFPSKGAGLAPVPPEYIAVTSIAMPKVGHVCEAGSDALLLNATSLWVAPGPEIRSDCGTMASGTA